MVRAMFDTLAWALQNTSETTAQFTFLSGQCFPLRPVSEFVSFVRNTDRPVLTRAYALRSHPVSSMGTDRVTRRHWLDGNLGHARKVVPTLGRSARRATVAVTYPFRVKVPDLEIAGGSQWTSVPRALAQEIVTAYRGKLFDFLKNAYASDEIAIPTFVYNSGWRRFTPSGVLEIARSETMAEFSNFHWLRPTMGGFVNAEDVRNSLLSNAYFLRKMAPNDATLANHIQSTW